jgi:hypothetical protein
MTAPEGLPEPELLEASDVLGVGLAVAEGRVDESATFRSLK